MLACDPIDYIQATAKSDEYDGLVGEQVSDTVARVWTDMIENRNFPKFRETYSDHSLVCVRGMEDRD